mgnify:CR=1 FL=1
MISYIDNILPWPKATLNIFFNLSIGLSERFSALPNLMLSNIFLKLFENKNIVNIRTVTNKMLSI